MTSTIVAAYVHVPRKEDECRDTYLDAVARHVGIMLVRTYKGVGKEAVGEWERTEEQHSAQMLERMIEHHKTNGVGLPITLREKEGKPILYIDGAPTLHTAVDDTFSLMATSTGGQQYLSPAKIEWQREYRKGPKERTLFLKTHLIKYCDANVWSPAGIKRFSGILFIDTCEYASEQPLLDPEKIPMEDRGTREGNPTNPYWKIGRVAQTLCERIKKTRPEAKLEFYLGNKLVELPPARI